MMKVHTSTGYFKSQEKNFFMSSFRKKKTRTHHQYTAFAHK